MSMKLKDTIDGSVSSNAGTATKLAAARTINGTNFDGSANITTANWGTARNIYIADSSAANTGAAISVNGSGNVTLKLPATIAATLSGKATSAGSADQATKLSTARNIQIGNKTNSFNGTGNISYTIDDIGAAKGQFKTATTAATAQWYRIAQTESGMNRVAGLFFIENTISGKHSITTLSVGVNYGINPYIQQLSHSAYSTTGISKARIVYHTSWSGNYAYLEVYQAAATAATMNVRLLEGVGWTLMTPNTVGSIPSGYTNKAIDLVNNSIVSNVKGSLSGNASTATKLQTKRTITIGNQGVEFDGSGNISFDLGTIGAATSGHNHDSTYSKTNHTHNYAGSSSAGGVATSAAKLATPVTLTIGAKGKTFDGSANQSWSLSEIGAYSNKGGTIGGTINYQFSGTGGHAIGLDWTNNDTNKTKFGGIGGLANAGVGSILYMGWGSEPWTAANNFCVSSSAIKYKNNKIYHAGDKPTLSELGAAAASHGTHVTYATTTPKANGTAAIGSSTEVARADHVHPLQTTISGNAATSGKWQTARTLTIGNAGKSVDGSANVSWSLTEIGAMPLTTVTETLDLNNSKTTGVYNLKSSSYTNAPVSGNATLFVNFDVGTPYQMFMHDATFKLYYRSYNKTDAVWNAWNSTLGNNISGNAGTATKLSSARTINGTSFDGSGNITTANWGTARNIYIADNSVTNTGPAVSVNGSGNATLKLPATIKATLSGNASTATKLAATKTINGTAFDGSGNITTANWGTSRNLQIGLSSKAVNGSGNVSWSLAEIGASPLQKSIVSKTVSNGTLTLSADRYQYATLANGNTIALPSVSNFTEINLFVKDCNISTIKLPDDCKWRVDPNLESGDSFMFTFFYTGQEWLAEVKIYS